MRIHIALVGVNRALSQTSESLLRELTPRLFPRSKTTWSLTLIEPPGNVVNNPRAEEVGELESSIPISMSHIPVLRFDQEKIDQELSRSNHERIAGEAEWSSHPESIRNLLRFLHALNSTFEAAVAPNDPDFVVFCRPDLKILEPLRLDLWIAVVQLLTLFRQSVAILPSWGRSRGLNDRFAILSRKAAGNYFCRIEEWNELFTLRPSANAEKLLDFSLSDALVLNSIHTAMVRLRIGQVIDPTDRAMLTQSQTQRRLSIYRARVKRFRRRMGQAIRERLKP